MTSILKRANLAVKQLKTSCLAHYAYIIESKKELAVVDPLRDIQEYVKSIDESHGKLRYVLSTHYHADFVSGFWDLAQQTGAEVVFGPDVHPRFSRHAVKHGDILELGNAKFKVLHTPGHTLESVCFVLLDETNQPLCVFTGDTLFLGDVGRPDLAQMGPKLTDKDLARMLFKSLKHLKELPDDCLVLPAHGAGSACGKNIGKGDMCNIGTQKKNNMAFAEQDEETFVKMVTEGLPKPPIYFGHNVDMNKKGQVHFDYK